MIELTEEMKRDLLALLREWRAGRLGTRGPTGVQPQPPSPPSRFDPLFQVTAVGGGVCSVQRVDASGNPVAATVLTGVLYDTEPAVGDNVLLARRTTGALCIFEGGGAGTLVSADDTTAANLYEGASNGKLRAGTHIALSVGSPAGNEYLTIAETGTRADSTQALRLEVRTSDPSSPGIGQIWLRSDL